ncbi:MAG TPA: ThuA domain-containing protein, partial [Bryobacteraceae bacterium]|nr:ThuA domain-containing protein [Bryobacteraceae bacterium]
PNGYMVLLLGRRVIVLNMIQKKIRLGFGLLAIALCAALALAQQGRGRGPRIRKVVLAWADTRNGIAQHDSTSHALALMERLGYESGMWDTYIRTDSNIISYHPLMTTGQPASGGPSLANVDAIFFMGHREIQLDDQQKADLLKFVHEDGKGFVASHVALNAMMASWPEFGEMMGGVYDEHPWGTAVGSIINEDPAFPATRHFPAAFAFTDEFYQAKNFSREKSRVLLRLDLSKMPANAGVHSTNGDFPLAWAKMYGKGRVFYSALGHDAKTWDNPDVYHMYFEAIRWALGMTEGDVTPRAYPGQ